MIQSFTNLGLSFLFSTILMFWFLDIRLHDLKESQRLWGSLAVLTIFVIDIAGLMTPGPKWLVSLYSVFVLIVAIFLFSYLSKYRGLKVLFALMATIAFGTIPDHLISFLRDISPINELAYLILCSTLFAAVTMIVYKYVKGPLAYLLKHNNNGYLLLCLIPLITILSETLYKLFGFSRPVSFPDLIPVRTLWAVTLISFVQAFILYKRVMEENRVQNEQNMIKLQLQAQNLQIDQLKDSEKQIQVYRHDLRHHFSLIAAYLSQGKTSELGRYIEESLRHIDELSPVRYCENETVNLILSYFSERAEREEILLDISAEIPQSLPLSNTEVCSILSNGLENAIKAAAGCGCETTIQFVGRMQNGRLALRIRNPFVGNVEFNGDIPVAAEAGHGMGVRSIVTIVNQHHGVYEFSVENGLFTLSLVI